MALNEIHPEGNHLSLPVPAGTKSGDPRRVGILNVVAEVDAATAEGTPGYLSGQNAEGRASTSQVGTWLLPVTGALAEGQAVYITSANVLTATATGNFLFGAAVSAKGAGAGTAVVKILQPGQTTASA